VIQQFRVASNPRYRPDRQGRGETYCNIFAWDVTCAMSVEIPHWVDGDGNRTEDGTGAELDANAVIGWLETKGPVNGWKPVDAVQAQTLANTGHPVVAAWKNQGGIGHLAMVRPGEYAEESGPTIAQSGAVNFNRGTVEQGFRQHSSGRTVVYYFHP
jgi:hypothetical protein